MGSLSEEALDYDTRAFPFYCVLVVHSSPWQVLCSLCQLSSLCSKLRTFSNLLQDECLCVYISVRVQV